MSAMLDRPRAVGDVGPGADSAWAAACIDAFGLDVHLVLESTSTSLVRCGGRLEIAGPRQLFEPSDLCDDPERELDEIAATRYPFALLRVPSASPTIPALRRRYPVVLVRDAGACPYLELDGEPERLVSKRLREDLRRAARKAARLGDVVATVHDPSVQDVDALLDRAFAVEAHSWKGRNGSAIAQDQQRSTFYRRYASAAARDAKLRIAFLDIRGETAAMQIAVEQDDALWILKIGYDDRFAQASPGQLLMLETLRWSAARGLARYDLLGTAAAWTRAWTRCERPCSAVYAYPASARGASRLCLDGVERARRWRA
jgi:CelD/BcsL family acetyltransferase involved in cellulose biosynthesis